MGNNKMERGDLPHIFKGASNSRSMGWLRNISLDFRQRPLISASVTFLPGLDPLTKTANRMKGDNLPTNKKLLYNLQLTESRYP